jgi:hypothetical protein
MVAERVIAVNEADIEAALEGEVLKAIVEQECVASILGDGVAAALDAVFIDEDDHIFEIGSEHVRLVAGLFAIEEQ